ncbi:unnamed protein product [Linum trigynum]|uniref:Uncharacterized protein n=1 Tax=Linum trigynum TaxID=586398 RepID=A0AAV2G629_9ROSI
MGWSPFNKRLDDVHYMEWYHPLWGWDGINDIWYGTIHLRVGMVSMIFEMVLSIIGLDGIDDIWGDTINHGVEMVPSTLRLDGYHGT